MRCRPLPQVTDTKRAIPGSVATRRRLDRALGDDSAFP